MSETPRYEIVFLNDDFTPMEFVVQILQDVFKMSKEQATQAMLETHRRGTHAIAVMDKAKAEATVKLIHERARAAKHPFQCILREEVP
jgi:ATP-dependent Clp protease adaptor protein ClpS